MLCPARLALLLALLSSLAGCAGSRTPVREATYGVFDAIQNPPPGDVLARDLRRLVQAYVERALKAGAPEDLGKLAGRITSEVLQATAATAPATRRLVGTLVNEALRTGIAVLDPELPALERTGARVAHELERGASDALEASLARLERAADGAGEGSLAHAAIALAERTAGATVHGATEGLRAEVAACQVGGGPDCGVDLVRATSRSLVAGAIEGVRHEMGSWLLLLAFALGALVAATAAGLVHLARHRPSARYLVVRPPGVRGPRGSRLR